PARSTLFPYTTLFRSLLQTAPPGAGQPAAAAAPAAPQHAGGERAGKILPLYEQRAGQTRAVDLSVGGGGRRAVSRRRRTGGGRRSEEHTSELQSRENL